MTSRPGAGQGPLYMNEYWPDMMHVKLDSEQSGEVSSASCSTAEVHAQSNEDNNGTAVAMTIHAKPKTQHPTE